MQQKPCVKTAPRPDGEVSVYASVRDTQPRCSIDLEGLAEYIRDPEELIKSKTAKGREHLAEFKNGRVDSWGQQVCTDYALDAFNDLKSTLPVVTLSGTFGRHKADDLKAHSGFMSIDLDHLGKGMERAKEALRGDPCVAILYTSPSGQGLKGAIKLPHAPTNGEEHKQAFAIVKKYLKEAHGLEMDEACKDVSRLAFICHDPECYHNPEAVALDLDKWRELSPEEKDHAHLQAILDAGALLSLSTPPPDCPVILRRSNGTTLGEAGNIVTIEGQVKSGKSGFLSAIIGAAVSDNEEGDFLGIEVPEREGYILHFDCEQSPKARFRLIQNAVSRRGGLAEIPDCLKSFSFLSADVNDRWAACELAADSLAQLGAIRMVIMDGGADFILQLNDEERSRLMVAQMHAFAIKHACLVVIVIHENPNGEGGKTRGHFGSELWRKSQSCIGVTKGEDGITAVCGKFLRDGDWPKKDASYFKWDINEGMHVSISDPTEARKESRDNGKREGLEKLASDILGDSSMGYIQLRKAIERTGVSEGTAKNRIKEMREKDIISVNEDGTYARC